MRFFALFRQLGDQCPELRSKSGTYTVGFLVRKLLLHALSRLESAELDWTQLSVADLKARIP